MKYYNLIKPEKLNCRNLIIGPNDKFYCKLWELPEDIFKLNKELISYIVQKSISRMDNLLKKAWESFKEE